MNILHILLHVLVTGIYFLSNLAMLKGNLVCKEIKSIIETLHKMQQALKLVTAKPHHLKN